MNEDVTNLDELLEKAVESCFTEYTIDGHRLPNMTESAFRTALSRAFTLGRKSTKEAKDENLKQEMLSCPFCVGGSWGGSDEFWNTHRIKHQFHPALKALDEIKT